MRGVVISVLWASQAAWGGALWVRESPLDPALTLAVLAPSGPAERTQLVAGYDSGAVVGFRLGAAGGPDIAWQAKLEGSVLALQPLAHPGAANLLEVVATTDVGMVACLSAASPDAGRARWQKRVAFNISQLAVLHDVNGDGIPEVAFGGADHRVTLVSGADGDELWSRFLEAPNDTTYVDCVTNAGDLDGDGMDDIGVRTWGAQRWAISGKDGRDIWRPIAGDPFLSTLVVVNDVNHDGARELLESGNDGVLRLCNGRDGAEIWRCSLGRPVRAVTVVPHSDADNAFVCFAGNAEGKVACITGVTAETLKVRWTADIGDVCRQLSLPGDMDGDGRVDVVAGAENGVVAAFSAADGKLLWKWRGPDVVRALLTVPDLDGDGVADLAVALLDGTLTLLPGRPANPSVTVAAAGTATTKPSSITPRVTAAGEPSAAVAEVPILLYHDVPPKGLTPAESDPLANFRAQMDLLVAGGYTAVSLDDVAAWIEGQRKLPAKPVVITFDGQYASHDTQLFEILRARGLFAVSYITTDWIGTANHLDWHELRRLEQSGVVLIENHSFNHPTLTQVSRAEVERQLRISNAAIARHLNSKVSMHHAYPNGPNNSAVREVVREVGFRTATAVQHRKANRSDNPFALPRYTIAEQMTLPSFKAVIGYAPAPYPALPYRYVADVGQGWQQPSYGALDAAGKLWVCDIGAANIRVFLPDGTEAPFSPIEKGLKQNGESLPSRAPSGVAVTPSGEVLVSIGSRFGTVRHAGLFRYRAADGTALAGFDLPYVPGDVDVDAQGLIYVVDKLSGQWHVYTADGREVSGSPFGAHAGFNICRGISVTRDSSTVYVISESTGNVRIWKGQATPAAAQYTAAGLLVEHLSSACGGVDVLDDGTVLVSYHDEGMIVAFDAQQRLLGQISGGPVPSFAAPRGAAFSADGAVVWAIGRFGQVQRWERISSVDASSAP